MSDWQIRDKIIWQFDRLAFSKSLTHTLSAQDLHMQVCQATGSRKRQFDHDLDGDRISVQIVKQRAMLVIVGHQPQLSPCPVI